MLSEKIITLAFTLALVFLLPVAGLDISSLYSEAESLVTSFSNYTAVVNNEIYFGNETDSIPPLDFGNYDFIIAGGGTAGGVLANRLTEANFTILVIEAGSADPDTSAITGIAPYFLRSPWAWDFNTTEQINSCLGSNQKACKFSRGKALGGTSDINAGLYVRGNPKDYDKWAELSTEDWSYENVLPYFKKSEFANFTANINPDYHGFDGLQSIGLVEDTPGLTETILKGFKEIGLRETDYNGRNQIGYSRFQNYLTYNIRSSTNYSFIRPVADRPNLRITLNSLVTKVVLENKTAVGVEFVKDGVKYFASASKEVIVSCGPITSPQVLMLSGIGPAEELVKHGIEIIADLPVGKNLYDHIMFPPVHYKTSTEHYNESLEELVDLWAQNKKPLTSGYGCEGVAFYDLNDDSIPDIEFIVLNASPLLGLALGYTEEVSEQFEEVMKYTDFLVVPVLLHPSSAGEVTLASNDPRDFPLINANYFSDESDLETLYRGIQIALNLNNSKAYQDYGATLQIFPVSSCDTNIYLSKEWWYCAERYLTVTEFHPIGTTSMGTDTNTSVVGSNLKVHGIEGLRVVDTGVIPTTTSGHTNAPAVMIAEKAADMLMAKYL